MVSDKEFCDAVHMEIHAVRRIQNYKPNPAEINISKLVMDKFESSCKECKERKEQIKNKPQKDSLFGKIGGILDGD